MKITFILFLMILVNQNLLHQKLSKELRGIVVVRENLPKLGKCCTNQNMMIQGLPKVKK